MPWHDDSDAKPGPHSIRSEAKVQVTDDIREWDYGHYEGLTSRQIREERGSKGLGSWDIWRDGCPGGEYVSLLYFLRRAVCLSW